MLTIAEWTTTLATGRVRARGQITLPRDVRKQAHIEPGDVLYFRVIGPGEIRVTALPNLVPRELRELYPIEGPIDEPADREAWHDDAFKDFMKSFDA